MMNYSAAGMAFILLCISLNNNDNNHDIKNNALTFWQHEERREPKNKAQLRDETPLALSCTMQQNRTQPCSNSWTCRFFFFFFKSQLSWCKSKTLKNGLTASENSVTSSVYRSPHAHEHAYDLVGCRTVWIEMADTGFMWGALKWHQQCNWLCGPLL